ncbi:MAG: PepSY-associated TM helix domain-containing protein [Maricaulaceae bacterium]
MTQSIWPKVSAPFVRALLSAHSSLGLAVAALLYLVCLTGAILVFDHELSRWEQPQGPFVNTVSPQQTEAAVALAYERSLALGVQKDVFVWPPKNDTRRLIIEAFDFPNGVSEKWAIDPSGDTIEPYKTPVVDLLTELHVRLHLPQTLGISLVGALGIALLASVISGLLAHPRVFKDAFALRLGGAKRLQDADLHNRLSVWGAPFHIVIALTGALLGLSTVILGALALVVFDGDIGAARSAIAGPVFEPDRTAAPLPPIAAPLQSLLEAHPDARFDRLRVAEIGTQGQNLLIILDRPGHLTNGERYMLDGTGALVSQTGFAEGSFGQQVLGALPALHIGWYGGAPLKVAYALLGLALTVIVASSVSIWAARRRDQGRPAPIRERLWIGWVWGQPLAFSGTALVGLFAPVASLPLLYLGLSALSLCASALWRDRVRMSRRLRAATALAFALLTVAHAATWLGRIADPMAWAINGALLVIAGLIGGSVILGGRRARTGNAALASPAA